MATKYIVNNVTGQTITGELTINGNLTITDDTNNEPFKIGSLTANTSDGNILSIDETGVIHKYPISGLSSTIIAINSQTSGYVLSLTDQNKLVEMSADTSISVTVPAYSSVSYSTGVQILLVRGGTGDVSVVADSGVTIKSANSYLSLNNQYSPATLLKVDTDTWYLFGDLKT